MSDIDRERLVVRRLEERCLRDAQLIPAIEGFLSKGSLSADDQELLREYLREELGILQTMLCFRRNSLTAQKARVEALERERQCRS